MQQNRALLVPRLGCEGPCVEGGSFASGTGRVITYRLYTALITKEHKCGFLALFRSGQLLELVS